MDAQRFDDLTRTMASGATRRGVLRGLVGGMAAMLGLRTVGGHAQQAKQPLCHFTGNPENPFEVIEVAEPAWETHFGHGDHPFIDCCLDADCLGAGETCGGGGTPGQCGAPVSNTCQYPITTCEDFNACQYGDPTCPGACGTFPEFCRCLTTIEGDTFCFGGEVPGLEQAACESTSECQDASTGAACVVLTCSSDPEDPSSQLTFCALPCPGPEGPFPEDFPCTANEQCAEPLVCNSYYQECEGCVPQGFGGCRRDEDCCSGLVCQYDLTINPFDQGTCVIPTA